MTAARRPRSAALFVGSTSGMAAKVQSAGQSLSRLLASPRVRRCRLPFEPRSSSRCISPLIARGSKGKRQRLTRGLANNLLKLWPALWTFAAIPEVEPTNNAAERGLRAAVIYRKLSFGSQSEGGQRTIERLLSVDQTCRLQRRSLYAYLSDALTAKARGDPIPTLA